MSFISSIQLINTVTPILQMRKPSPRLPNQQMRDLGFHFQSVLLAACIFITTGFLDFSFPLLKQEGGKDVRSPKFLSSLAGLADLGLDAE